MSAFIEFIKAKLNEVAVVVRFRIVAMWESGTKGKVLIAVAGVLVLLVLKCCLTSEPQHEAMPVMEGNAQVEQQRCIQRCQYCFREMLSGTWDPPSPCRSGRGHSYESIGIQGSRHFRCSKCGKEYELQYEPRGYIHCPRGQACQWSEL